MTSVPPAIATAFDYAKWFSMSDWDHFITLTFDSPISHESAAKVFDSAFVHALERRARRRIHYVGAIERHAIEQRPHIHAVLHGTHELTISAIEETWRIGVKSIRIFDTQRNGLAYLAKGLANGEAELLLRPLPSRTRRGRTSKQRNTPQ